MPIALRIARQTEAGSVIRWAKRVEGPPRRRHRFRSLLFLALVGTVLVPTARASGEGLRDSGVVGSIDLVRVRGRTRIVGWVSADRSRAPRVHVVVDDRVVRTFRPSGSRVDVEAALGRRGEVWGFAIKVDATPGRSVCLSVKVDGDRIGIDCWFRGGASFAAALGGGPKLGAKGRVVSYSVEVEGRTGLHPEQVAREVDRILGDDRSWIGDRRWRFRRVRPSRSDVRIIVASPATVDRMCFPLRTAGRLSCRQGNRVIMNSERWLGASASWRHLCRGQPE